MRNSVIFCFIKEHVEPCSVVSCRTMQGRKTCARRQEKHAADRGGGSSSIESLGSFWDCIINNPRSTLARRNAHESEGQGRKITDLNVFSTFCHGGAFRCTFLPLPSRNCTCVGSTNYKPIYSVLVAPFSSQFCVFRVGRTVSLSTPVMSQFFFFTNCGAWIWRCEACSCICRLHYVGNKFLLGVSLKFAEVLCVLLCGPFFFPR